MNTDAVDDISGSQGSVIGDDSFPLPEPNYVSYLGHVPEARICPSPVVSTRARACEGVKAGRSELASGEEGSLPRPTVVSARCEATRAWRRDPSGKGR